MNTSESIGNLAKALVAAQKEMPVINKDGKGHGYQYATLDNIMTKVRPVLAKHGLVIMQTITGDVSIGLTTRLLHESGEWTEDTIYAPADVGQRRNEIQAVGSTITYLRRYGIAPLLGLADETDTDGQQANGNRRVDEINAEIGLPTGKKQIKPPMPTEAMRRKFHALGTKLYGDEWDDRRPVLVESITARRKDGHPVTSSNELYRAEMQYLIDGMEEKASAKDGDNE